MVHSVMLAESDCKSFCLVQNISKGSVGRRMTLTAETTTITKLEKHALQNAGNVVTGKRNSNKVFAAVG